MISPFVPNLLQPNSSRNTNEPYLEFYLHLLERENSEIPQVISISYGDDEQVRCLLRPSFPVSHTLRHPHPFLRLRVVMSSPADTSRTRQTVPRDYALKTCQLMGLMGLRGITILHSSGDSGVGAVCQSNDGLRTPELTPLFPSSCPFVTSVGGTESYDPEVVWPGTGGGFSNYFAQPAYQKAAVDRYLNESIPAEARTYLSQFANFAGRAFPDIAAHSASPP